MTLNNMTEKRVKAVLSDVCLRMSLASQIGKVADYIPELARVSPRQFGISVCLAEGKQISVGHSDKAFSIQSISKAFTLALALQRYGDSYWDRVGREPSLNVFNSVSELESRMGKPSNPFVNAGAIVTTDTLLLGMTVEKTLSEILDFIRLAASDNLIYIDDSVAESEKISAYHNWALANLLRGSNNLKHECEQTLSTYFQHCAIAMSCQQLARAGRFLAGIAPDPQLISADKIRSINALMMTSGHYNGSGEFAYRVGLPAKSGVGGGILATVPGKASIAVWSPGLDKHGNSLLGTQALEDISHELNWSVFAV